MYEVIDLLDALDGHELNRVMKIKLADGSIHEIDGIQFVNSCIGGDDILYITEKNPLRERYEGQVEAFLDFAETIIAKCNSYYHHLVKNFDKYDQSIIYNLQNELGAECDIWFETLKLNIQYESGVGSEEELNDKLYALKCWLKERDIPKDVRP